MVIGLPLAEQEPFAVRALFQWWSASRWNALHSGVAVAEERSTHYDTADIALAIIVSPDTSGAPALAFSCSIITAALGIARASSALLSFARDLAITSSAGNSPVRGGEPLYASIVLRILISKLSDISLILVFLSQR